MDLIPKKRKRIEVFICGRHRNKVIRKGQYTWAAGEAPIETLPFEILQHVFVLSQNLHFHLVSKSIYKATSPSVGLASKFFFPSHRNPRKNVKYHKKRFCKFIDNRAMTRECLVQSRVVFPETIFLSRSFFAEPTWSTRTRDIFDLLISKGCHPSITYGINESPKSEPSNYSIDLTNIEHHLDDKNCFLEEGNERNSCDVIGNIQDHSKAHNVLSILVMKDDLDMFLKVLKAGHRFECFFESHEDMWKKLMFERRWDWFSVLVQNGFIQQWEKVDNVFKELFFNSLQNNCDVEFYRFEKPKDFVLLLEYLNRIITEFAIGEQMLKDVQGPEWEEYLKMHTMR